LSQPYRRWTTCSSAPGCCRNSGDNSYDRSTGETEEAVFTCMEACPGWQSDSVMSADAEDSDTEEQQEVQRYPNSKTNDIPSASHQPSFTSVRTI